MSNRLLALAVATIFFGVVMVLGLIIHVFIDLADNPPVQIRVCDTPSSVATSLTEA